MAIETERKYLVDAGLWKKLKKPDGTLYKQGYIVSTDECTLRVRLIEDKAYITIKGKAKGISRPEFEYEIPLKGAKDLLKTMGKGGTEKVRYKIRYKGNFWEVDVFRGDNKGLIVAEIELKHEFQQFEKPDWIRQEVTEDMRYANSNLSTNPFKNWK
jgi:adenylate cyclase